MQKWIFIASLFFLLAQGGHAMGFFSKPKHCVFSAVSGHLTLNGEPVKNARLVRTGQLGHAKSEVTDEAITDENGYFEFPDMYQSASEFGGLAAFVITQTITLLKDDGEDVRIWLGSRRDGLQGAENRHKPWHLECELSNQERMYVVNGSGYFSICAWDVEEDPAPPVNNER
ncbi:MAG: DUF6795 domain-containing protein [Cellvibrio sp.]